MKLPTIRYAKRRCGTCHGKGSINVVSPESLRARRMAAGISLRSFAAKNGVSAQFISDCENGRRNASVRIIEFYSKL